MKTFLNIIVSLLVVSSSLKAMGNELYSVSSKEMGITNFDYTVQEIERKPKYSKIQIKNFSNRSAPASRWMMCAYTDLTRKRGFENWAIYYPDEIEDLLLILFPETDSEDDPIFKQMNQDSNKAIIANIRTFAPMCGMKIE